MDNSNRNGQKHILYIPGMSGLKDMNRIEYLGEKARDAGYGFSFLQTWTDDSDLQSKTLSQVLESIYSTIVMLARSNEVFVVAKSFGGGALLLRSWPQISKMVLWSPTVAVSDKNSYDVLKDTELRNLSSMFEIITDAATLSRISIPVLVIRGTQDTAVPLSTLQAILKQLPQGVLKELQDMGHSPKTKEELESLVANTIEFLK
jgi:alpha-beta hydrolase superfamily lysophospholipase